MQAHQNQEHLRPQLATESMRSPRLRIAAWRRGAAGILVGLSGVACGEPISAGQEETTESDSVIGENGLAFNGLSANGLSNNGLSSNGLSSNGLSANGLSSNGLTAAGFTNWFNGDSGLAYEHALRVQVMKYLTRCALGSTQSLNFTDKYGHVHTWKGDLGLAAGWNTRPPTATERRWVSACLLAHTNANSTPTSVNSVTMSLFGDQPVISGTMRTVVEDATMTGWDGVYFGDLFAPTPVKYVISARMINFSKNATQVELERALLEENAYASPWGRRCAFGASVNRDVAVQSYCAFTALPILEPSITTPTPSGLPYFHEHHCTTEKKWCTYNGVTYPTVTVGLPGADYVSLASAIGGYAVTQSCTNCSGGKKVTGLSRRDGSSYFQNDYGDYGGGQTLIRHNIAGAPLQFEIRYSNGSTENRYARVKPIYNTTGTLVAFPPTGGWDVWANIRIAFTAPATVDSKGNTRITYRVEGPGTTLDAPDFDRISIHP